MDCILFRLAIGRYGILVKVITKIFFALSVLPAMFALLFIGQDVAAHAYNPRVDIATWVVEPSRLECRLWQGIPSYGRAVFANRAGDRQRFFLSSRRKVVTKGKVVLESQPPNWMHNVPMEKIAVVDGALGAVPLLVQHDLSSRLLDELEEGMSARFTHPGWRTNHKVRVEMTSVNFTEAYQAYLDCTHALLPHNFDQLERSSIHFDTGKTFIRKKFKKRMKELGNYILYDPDVESFVIDGHTDDVGRNGPNWELSQMRAERVKAYLQSIGIDESMLVIRYHGETRPKVKNNNKVNRRINRRVTIRLDRGIPTPGLM